MIRTATRSAGDMTFIRRSEPLPRFDPSKPDLFSSMSRFDPVTYRPATTEVLPVRLSTERQSMHAVRVSMGPAERDAALNLADSGLSAIWHDAINRFESNPARRDALHLQLQAVLEQAYHRNTAEKQKYQSPRPFQADSTLELFGHVPTGTSHPSGHATIAYAGATFLSGAFPDRAEQLKTMAANVARSRVLLGVHYPGDVAAGANHGVEVGSQAVEWR